ARDRTASSCSCSMARTSAVWATRILRWSIFNPSCAISADSMLRTTCFGCTSLIVSTWISLTSPSGVTTTRADSTPVRLAIRFSARLIPHGSGMCPLPPVRGSGSRSDDPFGVSAVLGSTRHLSPVATWFRPAALARYSARSAAELVVHLLKVVQLHEQHRERIAGPVAARHLARQPVSQHPERGEPGQRVHGRLKLRLRRLFVEVRRTRLERRPAQHRGIRERPARGIAARPAVPRSPVGRETDLPQNRLRLLAARPLAGGVHLERRAYLHCSRQLLVHHRQPRPSRLGRPHDLAAPEQLLARPEQRVVEASLARQDVHEPQLDAIHRYGPRDPLERAQPPHLAEPPAGLGLLGEQPERPARRRAPVAAPPLGGAAEVGRLLGHPPPAPLPHPGPTAPRAG